MKQIDAKKIPKADWDILCASFLAYMERKSKDPQPVTAKKNAAALQSVPQR